LPLAAATHATTTAEHLGEDVVHAATATAAATFLEGVIAVLVVLVTFLGIGKPFVGLLNFLEALLVATTIRVFLQSFLPIGFLDLSCSRSLAHSERLIQRAVVNLFRLSTSTHSFKGVPERESASTAAAAEEHF